MGKPLRAGMVVVEKKEGDDDSSDGAETQKHGSSRGRLSPMAVVQTLRNAYSASSQVTSSRHSCFCTTMFLFILTVIFTVLAGLLITVPLTGALVRLRANYNPKGLQLDDEGNVEPHTGPVVTSFFSMLVRVKSIEVGQDVGVIYWNPLTRNSNYRDGQACSKD